MAKEIFKKLIKAKKHLDAVAGEMENHIQGHCDFQIYIMDFPGDGWTIMTEDEHIIGGELPGGIHLDRCLEIIESGQRITKENFSVYL